MSRANFAALAAACFCLGSPLLASAHNVTWCASITVGYADSSPWNAIDNEAPQTPEYFWSDVTTANPVAKLARGAHYEVRNSSSTVILYQGNLYDGLNGTAGCTPPLSLASGTYDFYVRSYGVVQNNDLNVYNENGSPNTKYVWKDDESVSASGTKSITLPPFGETREVFRVYQAAAWALYRHAGGMTEETYNFEVGTPTGCGNNTTSCSNGQIDTSWIGTGPLEPPGPGQTDNKFIIVHELGHVLAYHAIAQLGGNFSYSYGSALPPGTISADCDEDGDFSDGSHAFFELEWVGAALGEGFADFYAADVWNNHDLDECWFGAWGSPFGLSCEVGSSGAPVAWVNGETCRDPDDPESGERIDWMRILWDVHTNAVSDPSFTYMLQNWLVAAGPWARDTAFTELHSQADSLNGSLEQNWLQAITANANYYLQ